MIYCRLHTVVADGKSEGTDIIVATLGESIIRQWDHSLEWIEPGLADSNRDTERQSCLNRGAVNS
ncbi:hypothetical protein [Acinetobacter baumannii]|uniref:hypothetical protein n=1 Tax=Acinetobacter baumannii TaxID=470 RepID=UPI003397B46A